MSQSDQSDECVSKKPWGEVLSRSLKLFTFNFAREGGKSVGRVVFYVILGLIALMLATYVIDSLTGWFSGWFDFWPFGGDVAETAVAAEKSGWFGWGGDDAGEAAVAPAEDDAKWYCKWNPMC